MGVVVEVAGKSKYWLLFFLLLFLLLLLLHTVNAHDLVTTNPILNDNHRHVMSHAHMIPHVHPGFRQIIARIRFPNAIKLLDPGM